MPVKNAAQNVRNRFVHVRPCNQNTENGRYVAGAFDAAPCPFGQSHDLVGDRGWMAAKGGKFTGCNGDFSVCFGKSRDRIGHEQDMLALIPEMFGNRHRRQGTASALQWRAVGGGSHNDTPGHTFWSKHLPNEIQHFATAFSHEREYYDVSGHTLGKLRQKTGLSDTRACEQADPLSLCDGQKRIEDRQTCRKARSEATTGRCGRRTGPERAAFQARPQRRAVERTAVCINDAPDPRIARRQGRGTKNGDPIPLGDAFGHLVRQHGDQIVTDAQDLSAKYVWPMKQTQTITDTGSFRQSADPDGHAIHGLYATDVAHGLHLRNPSSQAGDLVFHRTLHSLSANRF